MVVAKSAVTINEIKHRKELGFNYIELQLLKDFVYNPEEVFNQIKNIKGIQNIDVLNIHMPLIPSKEDGNIDINTIDSDTTLKIFNNCCKFAQELADVYKHNINIVIHNSFTITQYSNYPTISSKLINSLQTNLQKYSNIEYTIENVTPINLSNNSIFTQNGFLLDNIELVKLLMQNISKDLHNRIHTTLDTCHILTTLRTIEALRNYDTNIDLKYINLEYFFKANSKYCNNIHLCNLRKLGLQKGEHGAPFISSNNSDMKLLKSILELHNKYTPNALITIEVYDEDYNNCINLKETKKSIETLGYN